MKKTFIFIVALCVTILASCTKAERPTLEETVEVTFAIDAEAAMTTRAISDGSKATQLMYGVFNESGDLIIKKAIKNNITTLLGGYNMSISLAKGHSYQVVFWAQNSECKAYEVSDDMKVSINYDGPNNDENRDAFFGKTPVFKVEGAQTIEVVLKRPFAQVNVGAFPYDLEHTKKHGIDISKSSATISGIANKIDLLTGEATGDVTVSYSLNTLPSEKLLVDVDDDGKSETYEWLSMSYLLAHSDSSTHKMSFSFAETDGGNAIPFNNGLDFVPIRRNWRTNIVGQILSGDISFNIKIDPEYDGETINSGGLYYNFSENTEIKNKEFAFNTNEAATFTSENNNLITMEDVTFSGKVQYIAMGEYRDGGRYVDFTNKMTNVVAKNMVVTHSTGINNVKPIDYMAPLVFLRGETTLTNCEFTGTTSIAPDVEYEGNTYPVLPYDCGVPNYCNATFNNCTVDRMYAWSHSQITLKGTKVKYIRCSTHNQSKSTSHLTIDAGSIVDEIVVTSSAQKASNLYAPKLIIKASATVKKLDMNGRSPYDANGNLDVIIEEGATVNEIVGLPDGIDEIPRTSVSL